MLKCLGTYPDPLPPRWWHRDDPFPFDSQMPTPRSQITPDGPCTPAVANIYDTGSRWRAGWGTLVWSYDLSHRRMLLQQIQLTVRLLDLQKQQAE